MMELLFHCHPLPTNKEQQGTVANYPAEPQL